MCAVLSHAVEASATRQLRYQKWVLRAIKLPTERGEGTEHGNQMEQGGGCSQLEKGDTQVYFHTIRLFWGMCDGAPNSRAGRVLGSSYTTALVVGHKSFIELGNQVGAQGLTWVLSWTWPDMEDDWYSGGDTGVPPGAGGAIAGATGAAKRRPYGDSFTPPTSQGGLAGQQVGLICVVYHVACLARGARSVKLERKV